MFPFFKKKTADQIKKTGADSSVASGELLNESQDHSRTEEVMTELSIHPDWNLPKEKEYVFRFLNNDLQPLKPNQISLAGVEIEKEGEAFNVTAFVRNSLSQAISLEKIELLLFDADKNVVARKEFDLSLLGKIPGRSSRPWMFIFEKEALVTREVPSEGWSLAFNISSMQPHRLDLDKSWDEQLPQSEKEKLATLVSNLPRLKSKEFNIMGVQAKLTENGDLSTTVLFRNGNPRSIQLHQLPLEVLDAEQEVIAQGAFKLNELEVQANTSKPWTFIFQKELLKKEHPNLSKWLVRPVQNTH
ncbi:accessory Sec system S-layer assembly protein [Bacillus sp. AFS015802]|uniref:accessory Sec system S-layer assembly protein n=1 Tax=Bacillus sp. AFS015802 TaxID=2033486 RepID=UPI000BFA2243|nr:accessory Sec system S-layer assembly protein [Bacillus sp. AFS015802]PFA67337.1 accessory Sec system S-layer assembly protein [Bacillus sp. AFS015802]